MLGVICRSPHNAYGAYRMPAVRPPMNRSDIFSQFVPADNDQYSDDSFVVHEDDDDANEAKSKPLEEQRLSQLDPLERAELILRQRRRAKRLGIELLSGEDDAVAETPQQQPKKRRKIVRILSSDDDDDDG